MKLLFNSEYIKETNSLGRGGKPTPWVEFSPSQTFRWDIYEQQTLHRNFAQLFNEDQRPPQYAPASYIPSRASILHQQPDWHKTEEALWGSRGFLQGKGRKSSITPRRHLWLPPPTIRGLGYESSCTLSQEIFCPTFFYGRKHVWKISCQLLTNMAKPLWESPNAFLPGITEQSFKDSKCKNLLQICCFKFLSYIQT